MENPAKAYDCLIVGAGPAGLSAAVYLGRFLRKVLVVDSGQGRSTYAQTNDNYLGFPDGVTVRDLRRLGKQQAQRFGAEFADATVRQVEFCRPVGPTSSQIESLGPSERALRPRDMFSDDSPDFFVTTDTGRFYTRSIILAQGVTDHWPSIPRVDEYVGTSLFWCITCDGFRSLNKRVILLGSNEEAASTACQFNLYTSDITFVAPGAGFVCSDERLEAMGENKIKLVEGEPDRIEGEPGSMKGLWLKDGSFLEGELLFSLCGERPNNDLALQLGVQCDDKGYVLVDEEGYTNVPGVFAAGDLSRMHTHQVIAAAHEGAEAAQTANYYLYADYQKVWREEEGEDPSEHSTVQDTV